MRIYNPNCDGSGTKSCSGPEVRVLPTGPQSNAILCHAHYFKEIAYRKERNKELGADVQFDLPTWESLEVYSNE